MWKVDGYVGKGWFDPSSGSEGYGLWIFEMGFLTAASASAPRSSFEESNGCAK